MGEKGDSNQPDDFIATGGKRSHLTIPEVNHKESQLTPEIHHQGSLEAM